MPRLAPQPPDERHRTPARAAGRVPRGAGALVAAALLWAAGADTALADERAPRLKFRGSGSACLCANATDESAIARAGLARAPAPIRPASAPAATTPPGRATDPAADPAHPSPQEHRP